MIETAVVQRSVLKLEPELHNEPLSAQPAISTAVAPLDRAFPCLSLLVPSRSDAGLYSREV